MKKVCIFIMAAVVVSGLVLTVAYSQEDIEFVDNSFFTDPQRPSSVFVHDEHNEMAGIERCNICHHMYDDEGNLLEYESSEGYYCADCHGENDWKMPLMKAYHVRCKGCHEEQGAGPVMCGECHQK